MRTIALVAALPILLAGCSVGASAVAQRGSTAPRATSSAGVPPQIDVTPADKAAGIALDSPVEVQVRGGELQAVTLTEGSTGQALTGNLTQNGTLWTSSGFFDADSSYSVHATATGPGGTTASTDTSFTTMSANRLTTDVTPSDGETVGVGMPIELHFNTDIPADQQAGIQNRVKVTATPAVTGAWHWFAPDELHWRPQNYWPTGTKVNVQANLLGVNAGNGYWGLGDWTVNFQVASDKHLSIVNTVTHEMQVYVNDQLTNTWPVSTGRSDLQTINGTLVVLYKQQDVLMDSLSLGIPRNSPDGYYEHVYWDTAISSDGFFVHAAPWDVAQQGNTNVSHGCVNLSTDRAIAFFNFSLPGDIVQVTGSTRPASADDGEGDWNLDWSQWTAGTPATAAPSSSATPGGL